MERTEQIYTSPRPERRGRLKIFFGYAAGTGKTYTMLRSAHAARRRGVDVAVGYLEAHPYPQTAALGEGLEQLAPLAVEQEGLRLEEFDLDGALRRHPQLIVVDELAHSNAAGLRHAKRYQDIQELLTAGIDVYTTVNVQHIESLHDLVCSITGFQVQERIPDSVFDSADQVELVDTDLQDLEERLALLSVPPSGLPGPDKLAALRELALRRCADRMNLLSEQARGKHSPDYSGDERILVCLSSAPSNEKIIRTAARMAQAFHGTLTALFVETPAFTSMSEEDKNRLRANMRLAQQLGAAIETIFGDDVPHQIAEFSRLSGMSKVVIGRSTAARRGLPGKPSLTEKLIALAPGLDIYIIPDAAEQRYRPRRISRGKVPRARDVGITAALLAAATLLGCAFPVLGFAPANIITIYILAVILTAVFTTSPVYSFLASVASVLTYTFFFTEPRFTFLAYDPGYLITFLVMFLAALVTGSLAARLKQHADQAARAAYRTKVLFDTNQLLQKAETQEDIVRGTAGQLMKLLHRDLVIYLAEGEELGKSFVFPASGSDLGVDCRRNEEVSAAAWVLKNNKHAGATTGTFSQAKYLYLAIRVGSQVYGVVGIAIGEQTPDAFENSILLSILGECALAMENQRNAQEKRAAAILAKNEQLRANLLRTISPDLRTPLTSISGNASNLLSNGERFTPEEKQQIYTDIYDDSMWLISLVENLLSVSRLGDGQLPLHLSTELMDEVIEEALRHVNRRGAGYHIRVHSPEEYLLVKVDARLIVQVIINIVDNAIKYTPPGSDIVISSRRAGSEVEVSIADNGPGISDEAKERVFDMFFSAANPIADSRRSLGLGLALCKSIITAHGGTIRVADHEPHGAVFIFTLPAGEVSLHE